MRTYNKGFDSIYQIGLTIITNPIFGATFQSSLLSGFNVTIIEVSGYTLSSLGSSRKSDFGGREERAKEVEYVGSFVLIDLITRPFDQPELLSIERNKPVETMSGPRLPL